MRDNTDDFFGFQHKAADVEEQEITSTDTAEDAENTEEEEEVAEEEDSVEEPETDLTSDDTLAEQEEDFSFAPVIEGLAESGILVYDENKEYEDSEQGFQEVIADTVEAKLQEKLAAIPEDYRSLMDHLASGKTLQEWVDRMDPTDFANADLEDEQTQEILVREQYKAQGFTEAQIEKKVTKLKDQGLLDSEAEDAQEFLVEKQKKDRLSYEQELKAQQENKIKARQQADATLLADINSLDELENIKLTKDLKQELHKHLTVVGKDGLTAFQRNLSNKEGLLAAALRDLKGIGKEHEQRKATTKATGNIRKAFQKYAPQKNTSGKAVSTNIENTKRIPEKGMPWS